MRGSHDGLSSGTSERPKRWRHCNATLSRRWSTTHSSRWRRNGFAPPRSKTRTNRQLRRKFRQAVTFGSRKGAEVAIYLQVQRLHAQWTDEPWWETSHALYFDLWNLNPSRGIQYQ